MPHAMEHILAEALRVVSRSEEFAERNVRVKEKRELNAINTRDGRFTYEKGKKVTTPAVQCPVVQCVTVGYGPLTQASLVAGKGLQSAASGHWRHHDG